VWLFDWRRAIWDVAMVPDGSNRDRGIDISVPELNSTSVLSQISVVLKLTLPLAILCRLAELGPCMTSAKHAALWCRNGVSGSDFYSRARNFIAMPCTGSGILSVSSVFVLRTSSYVDACSLVEESSPFAILMASWSCGSA
jgi:hypothetical protein